MRTSGQGPSDIRNTRDPQADGTCTLCFRLSRELPDQQTLKADPLNLGLWEWGQEYSQVVLKPRKE